MSLSSQVSSLATRIGAEVKSLWTAVNTKTTGPASSTDNALVKFDGTSGKAVQNAAATISDTGTMVVPLVESGSFKATDGTGEYFILTESGLSNQNNGGYVLMLDSTNGLYQQAPFSDGKTTILDAAGLTVSSSTGYGVTIDANAVTFAAGYGTVIGGESVQVPVLDVLYESTFGAQIVGAASTTSQASLRLPHGTAPTSPTNGDIWTTTAGLYVRVNGSTVGPLGSGGSTSWGGITGTLSSQTDLQSALDLKAPLASPTFTGTVTAATLDLTTAATATAATSYFVETGSDGVVRPKTLANVRTEVVTTAAVNAAAATTVGTITTGVWNGSVINQAYLDSAIARNTGATDIEITDATKGVILKSANGTRYRITVDNDGSLTTTAL